MSQLKKTLAKLRRIKFGIDLERIKKRKIKYIPSAPPKALPKGHSVIEKYPLYEPFAHVAIVQNPKTGEFKYILDELQLDSLEHSVYDKILDILLAEIQSPKEEIVDPREFFDREAKKIVRKYRISLGWLPEVSWSKILYHAERDLVGYGRIDPLMRDPHIEDISCDGISKPVYVWHRRYENIETNLLFMEDEGLDDAVVKLVHMSGKHVSSAFPIVDASLPGKHRLAVCYRREVTPFGTAFTIRKFREDPYSIIDLINLGTFSEEMAAYFWTCLENRSSVVVLGGTAAGKTTALNALACLIRPGSKIVTIEETAELNLPHENWVSLIARRSYGLGENLSGEVTLFDLVKTAMRHRPDVLVVGEVRGKEAYVLFQALATGHGGMCTLHADSIDSAVKRLTSKPMEIAPAYIPLMNVVASIQRVHLPEEGEMKAYRRILSVNEVADYENYKTTFRWRPAEDDFKSVPEKGVMLPAISERMGIDMEDLMEEIERRKNVLQWMRERKIRSYHDVASIITEYYSRPKEFYEREVQDFAATKQA
ncbi:MAG: type II/IV secretion system ATPase subunit [Candidatus Bathyarchaeota archaeon]|nr:MAG: type II/IV secretion system ATPase subunit [Candidatus Bathyarchaeota archaeon]